MQKITVWDENALRLMESEKNLRIVMNAMNIKAEIQLNNEPPLIARNRINGKTPAIQIDDGDFWTHNIGGLIHIESLEKLFAMLQANKILK